MGSLFGWYTRKDTIQHLIKPDENFNTLAHCVRGNVLWAVQQWQGKDPFIACYLLKGPIRSDDPFGCGYKGLSEEEHPYYYNCPIKYLDMAPEQCAEWRDRVRKQAAAKATKLAIGMVAELSGCKIPVVEITSLKPLRGCYGYTTYRLKRSLLTGKTYRDRESYRQETGTST